MFFPYAGTGRRIDFDLQLQQEYQLLGFILKWNLNPSPSQKLYPSSNCELSNIIYHQVVSMSHNTCAISTKDEDGNGSGIHHQLGLFDQDTQDFANLKATDRDQNQQTFSDTTKNPPSTSDSSDSSTSQTQSSKITSRSGRGQEVGARAAVCESVGILVEGAGVRCCAGAGDSGGGDKGNNDMNDSSLSTAAELVTTNEVISIREQITDEASISAALLHCKRHILSRYLKLLGIMGLKPSLNPESNENGTCCVVLNRIYFVFVLLLILAGYTIQYLTCFRRDRGFMYKEELVGKNLSEIIADEPSYESPLRTICLGNPILIHLLPSFFHFSSFIYMVYLYRVHDDEQLPNLMERVFIHAAYSHNQFFTQKKLIRTLHRLAFLSGLWLFVSTACQVIQISIHHISFNFRTRREVERFLIGTLAVSTTWQDAIQVTVIISYCSHCIILSTYLELLYGRIQHHTISLDECTKELGELDRLLSYLNNELSPGLGPLLILNSATAVSSAFFLATMGTELEVWDLLSVFVVALLWIVMFLFPLIQAANLSSACKQVREIGHVVRLRPFGYQNTPREDLDSFLLFVSTMEMDVRIIKIPVSTPILACTFALIAFAILCWGLFLSALTTNTGYSLGLSRGLLSIR